MSASLEEVIQKKVSQLADELQVLEFVDNLEKRRPPENVTEGIDLRSHGITEQAVPQRRSQNSKAPSCSHRTSRQN